MTQQENCRLNLELQETKDRQEELGAQAQQLKDKVAQMKDTLGQTQQRLVSEGPPGNRKQKKIPRASVESSGDQK